MKNIAYFVIKFWIRTSLHLYFGKIKIDGLSNVPLKKPVLFLPNHQNALLDPLLIAVDCNRKPYFLTRSDVFKSSILNKLFELVRMIPIYRIRDGRATLKHNELIFDKCANLLGNGEALLMFPEANHNLERRVRPLSKGFTRLLFRALKQNPKLDIQLVPVGLNYSSATQFTDEVSIYFGKPIALNELFIVADERATIENIKDKVSLSLQKLTTHLSEENYDEKIAKLNASKPDYLNPIETNKIIKDGKYFYGTHELKYKNGILNRLIYPFFLVGNLPVILLWKLWLKPKVWEPEFTDTLRFALSLLVFPMYYFLLFEIFNYYLGWSSGLIIIIGLFLFNWIYVKCSRR
ncbi:lysophospholipid acyltransferase family protein [Aurantibacter sp.]|uniref:lysophospholipid acyltransferase family protein n=1 Tax=Aurantibacter sp. TaxID=2807103 RepID=UPI003263D49C